MKLQTLKESYKNSSFSGDGFTGYFTLDYSGGSFIINIENGQIHQLLQPKTSMIEKFYSIDLPKDERRELRYKIEDELDKIKNDVEDETREILQEITQAYFATIYAIMINGRQKMDKALDDEIAKHVKK